MSYQEKKIIIIGASELQIPIIQAAKNLGLIVIATDRSPKAIGFSYADHTIIADTMNPEETISKIKEYIKDNGQIHAVATTGTDASYTVAHVAEAFGLPGHSIQAALKASNKFLMREALLEANISIPKFKKVTNITDAEDFFHNINNYCVLKPLNSMGARGVSLVKNKDQIKTAFHLALKYNKNHECLIEEYINAHELSIDALITNGYITITGIADRIIEYSPYFVETGHILPSNIPTDWINRAIITFRDGVKALDLTHGAAKIDLKISQDQTWIIEIAARLSGGFMSTHTFPFATGIPLQEYMVKLALGELIENITPNKNLVSIERSIIVKPGVITHIDIPKNISEYPYITYFSFQSKIGDHIISPKNNLDKSGHIIATAPTREEAIYAINNALYNIKIQSTAEESIQDILTHSQKNIKNFLKDNCPIDPNCDDIWREEKIPHINDINSEKDSSHTCKSYKNIKLIPNFIHKIQKIDTSISLFGKKLSLPVLVAPITETKADYNDIISELELQRALLKGAYQAGTLAFSPDPINDTNFNSITQSILENYGNSILITKPRKNNQDIENRIHSAHKVGVLGVGIDISAIRLKTAKLVEQITSSKTIEELKYFKSLYNIPFVIKGILSIQDALNAVEAGATHIIISSDCSKIHKDFVNPLDMLAKIKNVINNQVIILIDGEIQTGSDIIKAIILGADGVLIGKPIAIHAIGGGYLAVVAYLTDLQEQLESIMCYLGVSSISELKDRTDLLI